MAPSMLPEPAGAQLRGQTMRRLLALLSALPQLGLHLFGLSLLVMSAALPTQAAEAEAFTNEQLEQMLAPIALYPDSLLAQVLMASTYPSDVAEAAAWSKANPKQQGDAAVKAVAAKPWDPSVASLVAFPSVIQSMGAHPEEVRKIGDAFLAQPKAVMDAVQRLRVAAEKAGNLKSNEQQKVVVEAVPSTQTTVIKIEPTNPQVVYVPAYNPTVVYGAWAYPAYPPYYWPPPPGYGFATGVMTGIGFGVGIAITNSLWGGCNWGHGDVDINVNRYNNINVNQRIEGSDNRAAWNHNASNRHGVPYRDSATRTKFAPSSAGVDARRESRGKIDERSADRARAEAALKERGADPAQGREALRKDPAAATAATQRATPRDSSAGAAGQRAEQRDRDAARQSAQTRARQENTALSGARDPAGSRQQAERGRSSRQSMNHSAPRQGGGHRR